MTVMYSTAKIDSMKANPSHTYFYPVVRLLFLKPSVLLASQSLHLVTGVTAVPPVVAATPTGPPAVPDAQSTTSWNMMTRTQPNIPRPIRISAHRKMWKHAGSDSSFSSSSCGSPS